MSEIRVDKNHKRENDLEKTVIIAVIMIVVTIVVGFIIKGVLNGNFTNFEYLTYSNYSEIHNGMTYSEVVDILNGHQGVLNASAASNDETFEYTLSYYTWKNRSGTKCIVVGFENGKVCAKSQYGLG